MRFQKDVSREMRAALSNDLRQYVKEVPMNARERSELRNWVQSGQSPYDNGWNIATDAGTPMDCVNALRVVKSGENTVAAYDTQNDEPIFLVLENSNSSENMMDEDLPF